MTYGSGASEPRSAARSKASQTGGSVQVGARGRVQPSPGIAGFRSPFAAPVLQAIAARRALVPHAVERWLTVGEVAQRLRVSTATVYTLCKQGRLLHTRVANSIRIREQALEDFLHTTE